MKKIILLTYLMSLCALSLFAQNVQIVGKAKITVMDTVTNASANVIRQADGTLALRQYKIGDMEQGGIVFYVDESGEHGLAADVVDLSTGIRWYAGTFGHTRAIGYGIFAGEMNTAIIISSQVAIGDNGATYAARLCAELLKEGYGDWYLPSREELNLMYTNLHLNSLGGFASDLYWSSTEGDGLNAWWQAFSNGNQGVIDKSGVFRVRAVRAF